MGQPVKLSDDLVLDARVVGDLSQRSIAGQIEFWARLGRAVEPLMSGAAALALRQSGDAQPLSALIASVDSDEGRQRVTEFISKRPFPHYEPADEKPGYLVRIEADGTRSMGRFVNRKFVTVAKPGGKRKSASKAKQ